MMRDKAATYTLHPKHIPAFFFPFSFLFFPFPFFSFPTSVVVIIKVR